MRLLQKPLYAFLTVLLAASLSACGEKTVTAPDVTSKLEESQPCFGCHGGVGSTAKSVNKLTGGSYADEWLRSAHNTKNGASCKDCHEPLAGHPNSCNTCHGGRPQGPSHDVTVNPDTSGKCAKCHTLKAGFSVSAFNGNFINTQTAHFNNLTGAKFPASFVTSTTAGACRTCHNPHDTTTAMATLRAWSRSGHGDTTAAPWTYYDFKTALFNDPKSVCNRCHTTTGFIKYVSTGDSAPWGNASDKSKEVLMCSACHLDYSYRLRSTAAVTAPYAGGPVTYPDMGASNLCLNCHVGLASGNNIKNIQRNYTSASFVNSHYLTAGGTVFGEIGYEFTDRNYSDPSFYAHRYLGTADSRGKSAATSGSGPCVACHLANKTGPGEKHTLKPYVVSGTTLSPTCETIGCHGPKEGQPAARDQIWLRDTWQAQYQDALAALNYLLANNSYRKLVFISSSPYFTSKKWHSINGPVTDTTISGMNNMGAAFNYNLLIHDRGGVAHNRYYTRRLIYDSIDWLDDNLINNSVGATLSALPGTGETAFKANAVSYLIDPAKTSGSERY